MSDPAVFAAIPDVYHLPTELRRTIMPVKEIIETREGQRGDPLDAFVSFRDLQNSGAFKLNVKGTRLDRQGGDGLSFLPPDGAQDYTVPPAVTHLAADGALLTVIVTFDQPEYGNHAYTEIWRADQDNLGLAIKVGETGSSDYPDDIGYTGRTVYYWARNISKSNVPGPFNATKGTKAGTGLVGGADLTDQIITSQKIADRTIDLGGTKITGLLSNANLSQITDATKIADKLIGNAKLADLAVDASKLADSAVTATKIANLAVGTAAIQTGAITTALIANAAVGTAQIANAAITSALIGTAAVGSAAIANLAVTNAAIASLAVDTGKIADLAVATAKVADGAITTAKIGTAQITTALIATAAITTALIADGQITTAKIADANITSAKIANAQINQAHLNGAIIDNAQIVNGAITTAKIGAGQITTALIGNAQVDTLQLKGQAVTIPLSTYAASQLTYSTSSSFSEIITSGTFTSSGAPINIIVNTVLSVKGSLQIDVQLQRLNSDGSLNMVLWEADKVVGQPGSPGLGVTAPAGFSYVDTPGAGNWVYRLVGRENGGSANANSWYCANRYILLLETKR